MRCVVNILSATHIQITDLATDITKLASQFVFHKESVVSGLGVARNQEISTPAQQVYVGLK